MNAKYPPRTVILATPPTSLIYVCPDCGEDLEPTYRRDMWVCPDRLEPDHPQPVRFWSGARLIEQGDYMWEIRRTA